MNTAHVAGDGYVGIRSVAGSSKRDDGISNQEREERLLVLRTELQQLELELRSPSLSEARRWAFAVGVYYCHFAVELGGKSSRIHIEKTCGRQLRIPQYSLLLFPFHYQFSNAKGNRKEAGQYNAPVSRHRMMWSTIVNGPCTCASNRVQEHYSSTFWRTVSKSVICANA